MTVTSLMSHVNGRLTTSLVIVLLLFSELPHFAIPLVLLCMYTFAVLTAVDGAVALLADKHLNLHRKQANRRFAKLTRDADKV